MRGVVAALRRAAGYEIYNLGGSHTTTLAELVALLEQAFGKKAILDRKPEQPGDVKQTFADVARAAAQLDWRPTVDIRDGVQRFATWYLAERDAGRLS